MAKPARARRLTDQEGRRLLQIVRRPMIIMASASATLVPAIARLVAADPALPRLGAAQTAGTAARDLSSDPRHPLLPWLLLRGR